MLAFILNNKYVAGLLAILGAAAAIFMRGRAAGRQKAEAEATEQLARKRGQDIEDIRKAHDARHAVRRRNGDYMQDDGYRRD